MIVNRIIPVLLLHNNGLVKTVNFKNPRYVGDPINAIKIFNEKEVDELIFLDINVSKLQKEPNYKILEEIAAECFMPLAYGGGITSYQQVQRILAIGFEKVIFNTTAIHNTNVIKDVANKVGSQSVVVSIDVKQNWLGQQKVFSHSGKTAPKATVIEFCQRMVDHGAGELFLNSVDKDGTMVGYDTNLIRQVTEVIDVPVIACGGAGKIKHLSEAIKSGKASAAAAGSIFVYYGPFNAVLISYPDKETINNILKE